MSSKRWTIVGLTLTLLIFGCSDSDVAKVKGPSNPGSAGATTLTSRSAPVSNPSPALPRGVDVDGPLGIPQAFQRHGLGLLQSHSIPLVAVPIGIPQIDGDLELPPLTGFQAITGVPRHFSGLSNGGSPIDPKGMVGPGQGTERQVLPTVLPGFEPPRVDGARLPQLGVVPAPPKDIDEAQSSISG